MKEKGTIAPAIKRDVSPDTKTLHCRTGSDPEFSDLGLGRVSAEGGMSPRLVTLRR